MVEQLTIDFDAPETSVQGCRCRRCGFVKPETAFNKKKAGRRNGICRRCEDGYAPRAYSPPKNPVNRDAVFRLRAEGLTYRGIGDILGISYARVQQIISGNNNPNRHRGKRKRRRDPREKMKCPKCGREAYRLRVPICATCAKEEARITREQEREGELLRKRRLCVECSVELSRGTKHDKCPDCRRAKTKVSRGYVLIRCPGHPRAGHRGWIFEHRIVMEQHLGRLLEPYETVHHLNGVRNDNRIENLEVWTGKHGSGVRTDDLVAWAREVLAIHEGFADPTPPPAPQGP